jgi:hypothetical protein
MIILKNRELSGKKSVIYLSSSLRGFLTFYTLTTVSSSVIIDHQDEDIAYWYFNQFNYIQLKINSILDYSNL